MVQFNSIKLNFGLDTVIRKLDLQNRQKMLDFFFVIFLCSFSFITITLFLQNHAETMIYYDSYDHFATGISVSQGKEFSKSPFILFISLLYPLFKDSMSALFSIRLISALFTIQLVVFFYLIGRKFLSPYLSLMAAIMALFTPMVLAFSVTLHDDIFAFAMGFSALYFSIKPTKLVNVILATTFISITGFTRIDTLIFFIIPYFIGIAYYLSTKTRLNFYLLVVIGLLVFFVPAYFGVQSSGQFFSNTIFKENIFNQFIYLVNYDSITNVFESSVEISGDIASQITGNDLLNQLFLGFVSIGILLFCYKNYEKLFLLKSIELNEKSFLVIYVIIILIMSIITLAAFHSNFSLVNNSIKIEDHIESRYVIGMKLILLYIFVYSFSIFMPERYLKTKNFKKYIQIIRNYTSITIVLVLLVFFLNTMLDTSVRFYENLAAQMKSYSEATIWLSKNLDEGEKVFLPSPGTFWTLNPDLRDKSYSYKEVWKHQNGTRIFSSVLTSEDELKFIRQNLKYVIHDDTSAVKYFAIDWLDSYGKRVFDIQDYNLMFKGGCEELDPVLKEAKRFSFRLPHTNWGSSIIICEIQRS